MKYQKLLSIATACLLLGASGTALSQSDVDCDGVIGDATVNNVTVNGTKCYIAASIVLGNITVTNSPNFSVTGSRVLGNITVTGDGNGDMLLYQNELFGGPVTVDKMAIVWIFGNSTITNPETNNMVFSNNTDEVEIFNNIVGGDLLCTGGNNAVVTSGNVVLGEDTCKLVGAP